MFNVTGSLSKHIQWHTDVRRRAIKLKQMKYAKRTEANEKHKWQTNYACQQFTTQTFQFFSFIFNFAVKKRKLKI